MLELLRRSRLLALALILVAPGITGGVVQWLHSCPVDAPWAMEHDDHRSHQGQSEHTQSCQCIGSCHTVGAPAVPKSPIVVSAVLTPNHLVVKPSGTSFVPAGTPSDLLPPATAPPLS
jgi:hypothetical protein